MTYSREALAKFLNEKWQGEKKCPVCQNNNWTVSEWLAELRKFEETFSFGGPVFPLAVVTCNVCGNTLLFNALTAGLLEAKKQGTEAVEPPGSQMPAEA